MSPDTLPATLHLRPAEGRRVRHPLTMAPIGAEGAHLPPDAFVLRRLAEGDLVVVTPPAEPAETSHSAPPRRK
jgi:hypothetical protein